MYAEPLCISRTCSLCLLTYWERRQRSDIRPITLSLAACSTKLWLTVSHVCLCYSVPRLPELDSGELPTGRSNAGGRDGRSSDRAAAATIRVTAPGGPVVCPPGGGGGGAVRCGRPRSAARLAGGRHRYADVGLSRPAAAGPPTEAFRTAGRRSASPQEGHPFDPPHPSVMCPGKLQLPVGTGRGQGGHHDHWRATAGAFKKSNDR